ncbi:hypothetical protein [Agrococcus sp. Marseille-Q4369]|uniref:hypothetical protein n=1 Tax=Agrococcus sp. Marseille-Q4369 TaxID=2810513 RepID=UPI001B8B0466|nr:hypothetical protein [Agrococcus sp. Marseille-Q4369]QUW18336.1 hypothetical protein JSQ78_10950 [Agrococcus sp. Marseille-Q4369]
MTYTPPEQPAQPSYEPTSQGGYQPAAPTGYQSYDAGQAYAAAPSYDAYGAAPVSTERKLSMWGLILGISSIVVPLFINAIAGGILSGVALAKEPAGKTMAIWGLVTSILGFIWAFVFWPIAITVFFAAIFATQYGY